MVFFFRSVNEVICHGIPDMRPLEDGDIMNGRVYIRQTLFYYISINELVVLFNILLYLKHWRCLQFIYILSKFNALSLIS